MNKTAKDYSNGCCRYIQEQAERRIYKTYNLNSYVMSYKLKLENFNNT